MGSITLQQKDLKRSRITYDIIANHRLSTNNEPELQSEVHLSSSGPSFDSSSFCSNLMSLTATCHIPSLKLFMRFTRSLLSEELPCNLRPRSLLIHHRRTLSHRPSICVVIVSAFFRFRFCSKESMLMVVVVVMPCSIQERTSWQWHTS